MSLRRRWIVDRWRMLLSTKTGKKSLGARSGLQGGWSSSSHPKDFTLDLVFVQKHVALQCHAATSHRKTVGHTACFVWHTGVPALKDRIADHILQLMGKSIFLYIINFYSTAHRHTIRLQKVSKHTYGMPGADAHVQCGDRASFSLSFTNYGP